MCKQTVIVEQALQSKPDWSGSFFCPQGKKTTAESRGRINLLAQDFLSKNYFLSCSHTPSFQEYLPLEALFLHIVISQNKLHTKIFNVLKDFA